MRQWVLCAAAVVLVVGGAMAQERSPKMTDSSQIGPDGTAYVTRVVPVPATISEEAQKFLSKPENNAELPQGLEMRRTLTDKWQAGVGDAARKLYPVNVAPDKIAGVPVLVVTPIKSVPEKQNRVLMNLHGGGFMSDSGSLSETIPICNLTGTKVVAVLYRLAPEHPFPAGLDDAVAVYKELLKTYKPSNIGVYGTSAGAIMTAQLTVKLKQLKLPLPAVTGIFSGMGDFSRTGDSVAMYSIQGLSGHLNPPVAGSNPSAYFTGATDLKDPVLSPMYADLSGFPPTLFVTSGRDLLLSGTTILHRAYLRAGVDAQLVVFEGLPHAFWNFSDLPESKEADQIMAEFLDKHLGK